MTTFSPDIFTLSIMTAKGMWAYWCTVHTSNPYNFGFFQHDMFFSSNLQEAQHFACIVMSAFLLICDFTFFLFYYVSRPVVISFFFVCFVVIKSALGVHFQNWQDWLCSSCLQADAPAWLVAFKGAHWKINVCKILNPSSWRLDISYITFNGQPHFHSMVLAGGIQRWHWRETQITSDDMAT